MADPQKKFIGLDDQVEPTLTKAPKFIGLDEFQSPLPSDNTIGRHLVEALPMAGAIAGGTLGPLGGAAGTGLGTMVKQALQKARPDLLGESPQGGEEIAADTGKELLLNNVLPGILGKLGRGISGLMEHGVGPTIAAKMSNFPAVREAAVGRMSQQIGKRLYPETGILEQGAANAAGTFANQPELFHQNQVGQKLFNLGSEYDNLVSEPVRTQAYREISNKTMSDVIHVQNAKLVAGPEFTRDLATNKLLTNAGNVSEGTIDAAKALSEMGGKNSEIYKEALGPAAHDSMKGLLEDMAKLQKGNATDTLMRYADHKLMYSGVGAGIGLLLGHGVGGAATGVALSSVLPLTNKFLGKLASDPEAIALVRAALRTPAKAPQADLINKALTVALPRLFLEGAGVDTTSGH